MIGFIAFNLALRQRFVLHILNVFELILPTHINKLPGELLWFAAWNKYPLTV